MAGPSSAQTTDPTGRAVATDHHVHVHSPEILAYLPEYCASPGRIGQCDPAFMEARTVDDLLAEMDKARIGRAWVMSTAYLAESPMMVPQRPDAPVLVHAANAFTVDLARRHPDRLAAFIGVNPLTPTALAEIQAWKDDPAAYGVKLHLTNSGVDLRDPDQVARLAAVFTAAGTAGKTILIHMRTRAPDYGAQEVGTFLNDVLPSAGAVPVLLGHSGGWGGLDEATWRALGAFAQALDGRPDLHPNLYFDLAQVYDAETSDADMARLADLMRRIGLERFVTGSDWPFAKDLGTYFGAALDRLPLTAEERQDLRTR